MINNKYKKLKDNAELAMASYGYFHLKTSDTNQLFLVLKDEKGKDRVDASGRPVTQQITLTDIMNITYKNYEVYKPSPLSTLKPEKVGKLDGDFTPTQAQRFFSRYDLLIHQPNTESGFSATLFGEKRKQRNTESKLLKELQCF